MLLAKPQERHRENLHGAGGGGLRETGSQELGPCGSVGGGDATLRKVSIQRVRDRQAVPEAGG